MARSTPYLYSSASSPYLPPLPERISIPSRPGRLRDGEGDNDAVVARAVEVVGIGAVHGPVAPDHDPGDAIPIVVRSLKEFCPFPSHNCQTKRMRALRSFSIHSNWVLMSSEVL